MSFEINVSFCSELHKHKDLFESAILFYHDNLTGKHSYIYTRSHAPAREHIS